MAAAAASATMPFIKSYQNPFSLFAILSMCADFLVFEAISLAQIFEVHKRCSWMNDTQKGDAKRQREKLNTDRETEKLPLNYSTENNKFPAFRILCVGLLLLFYCFVVCCLLSRSN